MNLPTLRPVALCLAVAVFVVFVINLYAQFDAVSSSLLKQAHDTLFAADRNNVLIPLHPKAHAGREPQHIGLRWNITQGYRRPDGVKKLVYLINGHFPGPTIETRVGDSLSIEVYNGLDSDEGISFHWHGLYMRGANEMDGAVAITQNATMPGDSYVYEFSIAEEQTGTFWYHSHSELQRADGLYGGLVVHGPRSIEPVMGHIDEEMLLMVGDWYHRSAQEVQASYVTHKSWGREPVPDSLLVNGRGNFNCSMAVPSRPLDCEAVNLPTLMLPQGRIRLRIVNVGAMSGFTVTLPGADLRPLTVDGGNLVQTPKSASSIGVLYPGERLDLAVIRNLESFDSPPALLISLDDENYTLQNKALTKTHIFPASELKHKKRSTLRSGLLDEPKYSLSDLVGVTDVDELPEYANQNVLLYTKIEMLSHFGNVPMGFINHTSWAPQDHPLIDVPRSAWDENQLVPWIRGPSPNGGDSIWVDVVINNLDDKGHPFHLHGHDFYVLSVYKPSVPGYHAYNPFLSTSTRPPEGSYNLQNPVKKDTIYIPSRGYAVLRFHANNPGIWLLHCHILWHHGAGMSMAFQIGEDPS